MTHSFKVGDRVRLPSVRPETSEITPLWLPQMDPLLGRQGVVTDVQHARVYVNPDVSSNRDQWGYCPSWLTPADEPVPLTAAPPDATAKRLDGLEARVEMLKGILNDLAAHVHEQRPARGGSDLWTREEFAEKMRGAYTSPTDPCENPVTVQGWREEQAVRHLLSMLRSLGYGAGCDVFDAMTKWYA